MPLIFLWTLSQYTFDLSLPLGIHLLLPLDLKETGLKSSKVNKDSIENFLTTIGP